MGVSQLLCSRCLVLVASFIDKQNLCLTCLSAAMEEAIMTDEQVLAKYGPVVSEFESSRSTKKYQVRYLDGNYSCNCPGFIYNKECRRAKECQENGLTGEPKDPLVEAVVAVFEELDYWGTGTIRRPKAKEFAQLLRQRLGDSLPGPVSQEPEMPRVTRMITLED